MRTNLSLLKAIPLLVAIALPLTSLKASLLGPNTFIIPALEAGPVGASLLATTNVAFNGVDSGNNILFSGSLVSSVWTGDTSNPFNGLTFTYQLFSSASSANYIDRLTLNRFAGSLTDVGYNGTGIVPARASRTLNGDLIAFVFEDANFQPSLGPGSSSPMLVIQTDSPVWAIGNASIIDGATADIPAFVVQAIPEPTTLGLLVIGFAALAARRKN
jgi:hypothetical protein